LRGERRTDLSVKADLSKNPLGSPQALPRSTTVLAEVVNLVDERSESGTSFPEGGTSFEEAVMHHDTYRETFHFHRSGFVV
jgi:hypothetical protein